MRNKSLMNWEISMASLHSGDSNFEITFINYRGAEYVIKSGDENQGVLLGCH